MAETFKCPGCNGIMTKTSTMNSSNATFHEYVCKTCWQKKVVCLGLNPIIT